jgi:hypothetical protein
MQCEQSEYQRDACGHANLGEGKIGKKRHNLADLRPLRSETEHER